MKQSDNDELKLLIHNSYVNETKKNVHVDNSNKGGNNCKIVIDYD